MWCDDVWELKMFGGGIEKFCLGRMVYYIIILFILYFIFLVVMVVVYICVIWILWMLKVLGERMIKDVNI